MQITERQGEILSSIIKTYIDRAEPVSSKFLEQKYCFGVCPATIRIEMQKLAKDGFICQPHISAGRIPTDKGYRFFVDRLFEQDFLEKTFNFQIESWPDQETANSIKFLQLITKNLALISSNLALGYLFGEKILWKDGWEEIIKGPEFIERKNVDDFFEMIDVFEKEIENIGFDIEVNLPIKVYIGKENPFAKAKEFSIIASKCHFSKKEDGILAILGPKRMDYNRNINLLNSLNKLLE